MTRLKKLKFNDFNEITEYYENNFDYISEITLKKIISYFNKNKCVGTVDIFDLEVLGHKMRYISVLEGEWGKCLDEMIGYAESVENYDLAIKIRDFNIRVFGELK